MYHKTGLHGLLFIHHLLPRSSHHGLLFIHLRPPPASACDCSSTASPSCLHQLLFIHGLLFIQPPLATIQLALHGLLFIQPSTSYCSTSRPRGPVHPPPIGSIGAMFIQRQRPLLPRGLVHPTSTGNCSSNPDNTHYSSRGSKIDRLQLAAVSKESLDRVQLTVGDRSIAQVQ